MASLTSFLPQPKGHVSEWQEEIIDNRPKPAAPKASNVPAYRHRQGFVPRRPDDFGGGGAFPEIHVAQYPLDMGRKDGQGSATAGAVVPVQMDADGKIAYDALVRQGQRQGTKVYGSHKDLIPKDMTEAQLERPSEDDEIEATERTRAALEKISNARIKSVNHSRPDTGVEGDGGPTYIRYTPGQQGAAFNSGAKQRIIRMVEMPKDPMEPPKFKAKKVPKGAPSPPVPVMHSPPRKLTVKDQQEWKIPPCVSNWKNAKGYTIPLDKRLAADGRGLQESTINDNFAKLSEALYIAERGAREEVEKRAAIQRRISQKEKLKKEDELRSLAAQARVSRGGAGGGDAPPQESSGRDREEMVDRDVIREERRRERERERRQEAAGHTGAKSKVTRDGERDISEKIALGQAQKTGTKESMYDQRLFNQSVGLEAGFGKDDSYNVYDKPLFAGSSSQQVYRPKKTEGGIEDESIDGVLKTARFKPTKDFDGVDRTVPSQGPRDAPVEFEREVEEDPFGLDQFMTSVKKGKDDHERPSKRSRVDYDRR